MLRALLLDNPMLIEVRRFFRRMISTKGGSANLAAVILISMFYAVIVYAVAKASAEIDPVYLVMFQTGLFSLLLPVMVSGAIAGERERRTWEVLLVAPVTKAQIVAGKFVACSAGLTAFFVACLVPSLFCLFRCASAHLSSFVATEVLSFSFGTLLVALTLYISSRSKTTFAALGVSMGIVFTTLAAVPTFVQAMTNGQGESVLNISYPFTIMSSTADFEKISYNGFRWSAPLINSALYVALAVILLSMTVASVRRMEEIRNAMSEPESKRGRSRA